MKGGILRSVIHKRAYWFIFLVPIWALSCSSQTGVPSSQVVEAQRPALEESWDIILNISEDGLPRIRISSWHMERYDDPDSLFTLLERNPDNLDDRVDATFFDSLGSENGTLTAESVRFDEDGDRLIATGDVHVRVASGRLLQAEQLKWDQAQRRIEVPGFVNLETEDETIRGFGLESDESLDNYVIRRITGTVAVPEDRE